MTRRVDPQLMRELKEYGAVGVEKCINCGNCTAVCSLSSTDDRFPRYMLRLAQLGMQDELLGSKELWLCYNCGVCSDTCPQQAEPANFMAAARC
jgi:quinone-modifying oxidoreductase, subunit QmoC